RRCHGGVLLRHLPPAPPTGPDPRRRSAGARAPRSGAPGRHGAALPRGARLVAPAPRSPFPRGPVAGPDAGARARADPGPAREARAPPKPRRRTVPVGVPRTGPHDEGRRGLREADPRELGAFGEVPGGGPPLGG